ncbi:MAG: universal stress protein [Acidobacteria bacterium]|nr:universal stress protein [Acidobacteriota bacterium]
MPNEIAVGISDQAASGDALAWAMAYAATVRAEIVLIHVIDHPPAPGEAAAGRRLLSSEMVAARSLSPRSTVRVRTLEGSIMWQLVAASDDYDLIVVGTHKTGFIHGSVYGSASLSLAATAACPVVVVPAIAIADPEGVVVGADASSAGSAALRFAAAHAATTGQALTIVRVTAGSPASGNQGDAELLARHTAIALAAHPDLVIRTRQLMGSTAETLVAASASSGLLVLGDSRTGSSAPPALGLVCHDALVNIRVPTVIVHSADSASSGAETQRAAWMRSVRAARAGSDDVVRVPL